MLYDATAEHDVDLLALDGDVEQIATNGNKIGRAESDVEEDGARIDRDDGAAEIDKIVGEAAGARSDLQNRLASQDLEIIERKHLERIVARLGAVEPSVLATPVLVPLNAERIRIVLRPAADEI